MWPPAVWTTTLFAALAALVLAYQCPSPGLCLRNTLQHIFSKFDLPPAAAAADKEEWNILHHLGGNSPWIPHASPAGDTTSPPPSCRVEQVHLLSRHAERYPTLRAGIRMLELYHRLAQSNTTFTGPLTFINTYNFFMPDPAARLEALVPVGPYAGTLQAFSAGTRFRTRYEALLATAVAAGQTRFWAADAPRVQDSARYFAAGLFGLDWAARATLVVVPETPDRGGDTLTPGVTCAAYREDEARGHDAGYARLAEWQAVYLPGIVERLADFAPGLSVSPAEVYTMQEMCGFEILARGQSPWCDVFTPAEWEAFEYARDVLHFYRSGEGNQYGPALGWLWLNATATLLLGDTEDVGSLFFSFVHDGDIVPMLAALGAFPQHRLPTDRLAGNRTWRTSDLVPMGGRVVLERLACQTERECWSNAPFYPNHIYCTPEREDTFVRIGVNDGVVPLPGCQDGPGQSCALDKFVEHVARREKEVGDFRSVCKLGENASDRITFLRQPPAKVEP